MNGPDLSNSTETSAANLGTLIDVVRDRARNRVRRVDPGLGSTADAAIDAAIDAAFDRRHEEILGAVRGIADPPVSMAPGGGRAAVTETIDHLRALGERTDSDPDVLIDFLSAVAEASATSLMSAGGGAEPPEPSRDPEPAPGLVRALLLGLPRTAAVRDQATVHGIDTDRDYLAFRARPSAGHGRADLLAEVATDSVSDGLMVWAHGELVGFLAVAPTEVRTGVLGLGPPRRPDRLAESFHLASRAVECAVAFGLTGVQGFDTLGLLPAIVADTDVGESLRRRYVRPAAGLESQPDLLRTIRMYFACGMHVERTARALFLHANTLRYRIARFEELTGATLRTPASAMEVWWALQHDSFVCRAA